MTTVIERYAKTRGIRLIRAGEGEFLMLQDSARGHFPVYMHARGSSRDGISLRAHWSAGLGRAELSLLHECVKRFNDHNPWLTASVREGPGSFALRIVGHIRFRATDEADFGVFARFLDMSLSTAARLFERVYSDMTVRYLQTTG
ncbi:MAG: hypothetical protein ACM4D3_13140 [Candidatus Sericytochromatia bacterium]